MKIRDLIDDLKDAGNGDDVTLGDIMQKLQGRSLGVLLTLVALLNLIPFIGILPGIPAITGTLLIVIAVQSLFSGRSSVWLPERWAARRFRRDRLEAGLDKVKPWFVWLDNVVKPRQRWLVNRHAAATCAIFLALMFYPLSFIPWGVDVPAIAVLLIGLSLIGRDGFIAVLGYAFSLFSLWFVWNYAPVAFSTISEWIG
jgi:hypothetical protein